jgi:CBS domain containing-hemolysin-like protein
MKLKTITIHTVVVKAGMTVREVFEECTRANTPGLPVCDDHDRITGRITLKHILKRFYRTTWWKWPRSWESRYPMFRISIRWRNNFSIVELNPSYRLHMLRQPPSSTVKALALMENIDTSYLFVIDEGSYQGVVTL